MAALEDLVFVGFNSRVAALNRDTGEIAWQWVSHTGSGDVTIFLDEDRLIVSVEGYTYCLNPENGEELWFNALQGFGTGVPSITSISGSSPSNHAAAAAAVARRRRRND
jgi:hypothetical protein